MIEIDKHSGQSVHQQVVNAMRFRIAGGQYRIGGRLPATRKLASQLGISFHTVRKAYQQLEEEGLVEARAGSGFIVKDAAPLSKSERMERGASILGAALKEAVGIGLDEEEITYLLDEQISLLESEEDQTKIVNRDAFSRVGSSMCLSTFRTTSTRLRNGCADGSVTTCGCRSVAGAVSACQASAFDEPQSRCDWHYYRLGRGSSCSYFAITRP